METFALNDILKEYINSRFPNLLFSEKFFLNESLINICDDIVIWHHIKNKHSFYKHLYVNNYQYLDILLTLVFPYMNENFNYKNLFSFSDIFTLKAKQININLESPKYLISNFQYDHCIRNGNTCEERKIGIEYIQMNLLFIKETIKKTAHKLFVNWTSVKPYSMLNYKNSDIFKQTHKHFMNGIISIDNPLILQPGDFYEIIYHNFYLEVQKYKFLFYELFLNVEGQEKQIGVPYFLVIFNYYQSFLNSQSLFDKNICDNNVLQLTNALLTNDVLKFNNIQINNKFLKQLQKNNTQQNSCSFFLNFVKLINNFKNSWLIYYFLNNDKVITIEEYITLFQQTGVTIKNLYNYSKLLISESKNKKLELYPKFWVSLTPEQQTSFLNKINSVNYSSWFNVTNYLKRFYIDDLVQQKTVELYNNIHYGFIDKIFESRILNGSLSYLDFDNKKIADDYKKTYNFLNNTENTIDLFLNKKTVSWGTLISVHWLQQIVFFHKYLNHRVLFITGSTGVGKSTQMPKLLLYSLKIFDYKNSGGIICSQPTINTVKSITAVVHKQLNLRNSDSHVSLSFRGDKRETPPNHLYLQIVTDGILFEAINNNLLLYDNKNIFDIIIVDEAHQHNLNMDLILTLLKYSVLINNDIRLVITSATMDDDEPIYRRYYRDINDNLLCPINLQLKTQKLDRHVIDRRIHVGSKTLYEIKENFIADKTEIETVKMILNTSSTGDILVFQVGAADILNLVKQINIETPDTYLAIPYFSGLSEEIKSVLDNFDTNRSKITIPKNVDFHTAKIDEILDSTRKQYSRYIIVGTNKVEASVTIDSLRYVVDNGKRKFIEYDFHILNYKEEPYFDISEQSRKQRKGRVGRVAEGTVYYLYDKHSKENIKTLYSITTDNLCSVLLKLIKKKDNKITLTFLKDMNFNNITNEQLKELVTKNYVSVNYIGNPAIYDYEQSVIPNVLNLDGFSYDILNDEFGVFYIIHPNETELNRNILGKICKVNPFIKLDDIILKKHQITSKKMQHFWNMLISYNLIYKKFNDYIITSFGIQVTELSNKIMQQTILSKGKEKEYIVIDDKKIKFLEFIISYLYYPNDFIFSSIIALYIATENEILKIFRKNKLQKIYSNRDHEFDTAIDIVYLLEKTSKENEDFNGEILQKFILIRNCLLQKNNQKVSLNLCESKQYSINLNEITLALSKGFKFFIITKMNGFYIKMDEKYKNKSEIMKKNKYHNNYIYFYANEADKTVTGLCGL